MMSVIQKLLNIEEKKYTSNAEPNGIKSAIEDLFKQQSLNVNGKLLSETEFTVYDNWIVVNWDMPNTKRRAAYLFGRITSGENGSIVDLKVKPNTILPLFAVASVLSGFTITLLHILNMFDDILILMFGLFLIAAGSIYYPLSIYFKNRLRDKIVKYLELTKWNLNCI